MPKPENYQGWSKKPVEAQVDGCVYMSIAFTWHLPDAFSRAAWHRQMGRGVKAGGPAVRLMPEYLQPVADTSMTRWRDALFHHNPAATRTTVGCPRSCAFCGVPKIEGKFRELILWEPRPLVCDNNLLAASRAHFDRVIDGLKTTEEIDFNQGLDARLMTPYVADRLRELDLKVLRFAFDHVSQEESVVNAIKLMRNLRFNKKKLRVYVLIGFQDSPEDALYRLRLVQSLGIRPMPMRYNALDALRLNSHVGENWTDHELHRYQRYWSRLAWLEHVPFEDYK